MMMSVLEYLYYVHYLLSYMRIFQALGEHFDTTTP